jgi:hypothetical protein
MVPLTVQNAKRDKSPLPDCTMDAYIILHFNIVFLSLIYILVSVGCQKGAYIKDSFSAIDSSTPIGSHLTESTEDKKLE